MVVFLHEEPAQWKNLHTPSEHRVVTVGLAEAHAVEEMTSSYRDPRRRGVGHRLYISPPPTAGASTGRAVRSRGEASFAARASYAVADRVSAADSSRRVIPLSKYLRWPDDFEILDAWYAHIIERENERIASERAAAERDGDGDDREEDA